ncbi:hypothetical protein [Celerinatantimonas sp. MCCC 1A17872]|uniref:hypothetical protein n=1 Tax=Celerinatantimonas sp. MCCC 1A17872 TaxID=3177514 RepID=UPI0038C1246E
MNTVAVITGDIVNSRALGPTDYDNTLDVLNKTLKSLLKTEYDAFDIYRGDSFQILFQNASFSFYAALVLRLALKAAQPSVDIRQSIGIGKIDAIRDSVKSSTGDAFTLSGMGLDRLKNTQLLGVQTANQKFTDRVELVSKFLDVHLLSLTAIQAQVLLTYLSAEDKSHAVLAALLGKKRSNTTRLLNASHYQLVAEYLDYVHHWFKMEYSQ